MRLRNKPTEPKQIKNKRFEFEIDLWCDPNIAYILDILEEHEIEPENAHINIDRYYDDELEVYLVFSADETDGAFEERLRAYKKNIADYNKWYSDNKIAIEEEMAIRKREEIKNDEKNIERIKKHLKEGQEQLKKEQENIKRKKDELNV